MIQIKMELKVLLPYFIYADVKNVLKIVMETKTGFYGLLPQRLDCVAALVPGIFTYESETGIHYLAVDGGILVKTGDAVFVSVRNAIGGVDLGELRESVEREFINLDESEKKSRSVMAKLENGFLKSMEQFRKA